MKLLYSEQAVADLARLRAFIAENDPAAASRIAARLLARMEHLCQFPHMGIDVPRAAQRGALRDMVFGNYIVRYAAQTESVVVLRIWHHLEDRPTGD